MGVPAEKLTLNGFLDWENAQTGRHEFFQGDIFAMTGARRTHGEVVGNLFAALKQHLRGSPCRAYMEGMKLQVADDAVCYPDVFVTCDADDLRTDMVFRSPTLVVEVLSPSTAAFDQGLKFSSYRRLASLKEYVLIDPDTRTVAVFRRNAEGLFVLHDQTGGAVLELASVECALAMADVFEGVTPGG